MRDICSTLARSGVPLDLIAQITKHLKRQMILLGNQLGSVPLFNITDGRCDTQWKHKSKCLLTSVTLIVITVLFLSLV